MATANAIVIESTITPADLVNQTFVMIESQNLRNQRNLPMQDTLPLLHFTMHGEEIENIN